MFILRKFILSLSLLLASSVAPAALLQFDLYASPGDIAPSPPTDWHRGKRVPTTLHISFELDTQSAKMATYRLAPDSSNPSQSCLGHFTLTGLAVSDLSIKTDRGTLWSSNKLNGNLTGDNVTRGCPGGFFAALSFSKGKKSFSWSFDPSPGINQADFVASADPLATLLLGFQQPLVGGSSLNLTGNWGTLYARTTATITGGATTAFRTSQAVAITAVPLPTTILLFASGLMSIGWKAWRGVKAR